MEGDSQIKNSSTPTPSTLKVFTMNIWGMPFGLSKAKSARIAALGEALSSTDYDVICLQEVWETKDFDFIHSKVKNKLPYQYYFYSGLVGSGLGMISKWPIVKTFYYKFPLNGYIHKLHHGDWYAGKGVALAQIEFRGKRINVFNTHLHAQYCAMDTTDEYVAHRLSQAYEIGELINLSSEGCALTLLAGDCNSRPTDICFRLLSVTAELTDSLLDVDNELEYGTNESSRNSFSPSDVVAKNPHGHRIDYILFKSNSRHSAKSVSYKFALPDRIPGTDVSYSDHEAIEATIELTEIPCNAPKSSNCKLNSVVQDSSVLCDHVIKDLLSKRQLMTKLVLVVGVIVLSMMLMILSSDSRLFTFILFLVCGSFFLISAFQLVLVQIELQSLKATKKALDVQLNCY